MYKLFPLRGQSRESLLVSTIRGKGLHLLRQIPSRIIVDIRVKRYESRRPRVDLHGDWPVQRDQKFVPHAQDHALPRRIADEKFILVVDGRYGPST